MLQDTHLNVNKKDINNVKRIILNNLTEKSYSNKLIGLEDQYNTLYDICKKTIQTGESNSTLLIGNRGCGKTMIVNKLLDNLNKEFNKEKQTFLTVRLNGLIQSDDRLALKEMIYQLSQEEAMENLNSTSFSEVLSYLLNVLSIGTKTSMPVIIILDEFDLFTQHNKQTLLYNLFDIAQSNQNPIVVIGLTCQLNVVELLEKRVKSRYSHRQILCFPPLEIENFEKIIINSLKIPENIPNINENYVKAFNNEIDNIFKDESMKLIINRLFDITNNPRNFLKICLEPIYKLSINEPYPKVNDFLDSYTRQYIDSKTELLKGTSILELCLIIAMKCLLEKHIEVFNFEMIYNEYKKFVQKIEATGNGREIFFKKQVAMKALEHLISIELVLPTEASGKCPKEYRMMKVLLEPNQITQAVLKHSECPTSIKQWGTRWL